MKNTKQKISPPVPILRNPWKFFFIEAFLFFLTFILGIAAAFKLKKVLITQDVSSFAASSSSTPFSFWQFILYFIFITLFILFLIKFFKKGKTKIFKFLFILTVFFGSLSFFSLWISGSVSLILSFLLVFSWLKKPSVLIHNLLVILSLAGIGSVLGLKFSPLTVVSILIILSIYDFIAVYKTKHMVKMAKEMVKSRAILALIIPAGFSDFKVSLKEIKLGGNFIILGGGDVILPLLLAVSLFPQSILNSLIVMIFSLIGLFFSFWIFINQKTRRAIPALPPIALFSIIGFLLTLII